MIVKNEALDIKNCLDSIKDYVHQIVIADTGSTDDTLDIIEDCLKDFKGLKKIFSSDVGMLDGKIVSFAEARNNLLQYVDSDMDYVLSLDADDVFINPEKLCLNLQKEVIWLKMYGQDKSHQFNISRIWKHNFGVYWEGNVHEYLVLPIGSRAHYSDLEVMHRYGDSPGQENGTERNLRIMKKEIDEGRATSRTWFYYGNQLRESGQYRKAIEAYNKYLPMSYFRDEKALAYAYRARCTRLLGHFTDALQYSFEGLAFDSRWNELWMELAFNYYELGEWKKCIAICDFAESNPMPVTNMFLEVDKYTTQIDITRKFAKRKLR